MTVAGLALGLFGAFAWPSGLGVAQTHADLAAARSAISEGAYRTALDHLTKAIEAGDLPRSDLARTYFFRAGTLQQLGRLHEAISDYDKAIDLQGNLAPAYMDRGIAYYWLGDYFRAITDYNRTLRLRPNFDLAYINRGNALQELDAYDLAIRDYNRAIALNPNAISAFAGRATALYRQRDFVGAITDYTRAIAIDRSYQAALWGRGYATFNLGQMRAAAIDFATLLTADARNIYATLWRYLATAQRGDIAGAARQLALDRPENTGRDWPAPIVAYMLGEIDARAAIAGAFSADPAIRRQRLAEAYFSLGLQAGFDGDAVVGIDYLGRAADLGGTDFADALIIEISLARLAATARP
ncbi:MAG: tetratricopeptide repeat protein [Alphaproteobacteria bacterium]|nr:tetratricopeptide repeat protein [Alphaproteobacteria bacterium]